MRPPAGRRPAAVLAGTAAGLCCLLLAPGAALAVPSAAATPSTSRTSTSPTSTATDGLPVQVDLEEVSAGGYDPARPEDLLTVRVRVTNLGSEALSGVQARLVVQRPALRTRQAVAAWAAAPATRSFGSGVAASDRVAVGLRDGDQDEGGGGGDLAAGAATGVTLQLPVAQLGTSPGAHGLAVEVVADGVRVGVTRSFVTARDTSAVPASATRLTLLLPVVAGRSGDGSGISAERVASLAEDGRWGRLLEAGADPRVAWALDPALVAAARSAAGPADAEDGTDPGEGTTADGTEEPPAGTTGAASAEQVAAAATELLGTLRTSSTGRDVVVLPTGDPDLASLARSPQGRTVLTAAAAGSTASDSAGASVADELPGALLHDDVAWPADEAAGAQTLQLVAGAGDTTIVLDDDSQPADADLTYTPTGRSRVPVEGSGASLSGLVADSTLSDVLALAQSAGDGTGSTATGVTPTAIVQRFVAETATATLERPNDPRSLLVVAPRTFDPDPAVVGRVLQAVQTSGWGTWQTLDALEQVPVPDVERGEPVLTEEAARGLLPGTAVSATASALGELDAFSAALLGEDPALPERRRAALLLVSASWRGHAAALPAARSAVDASVEQLLDQVSILPGGTRNLAATRSELPVTVVNELDVPVRVDLLLRPRSPRVQLDRVARQEVPAGSQRRVAVPVRALANGSVVIDAQLTTPDGTPIGGSTEVELNVAMGVEGWVTGTIGGIAGVLLVVGVVRAVRRPRRRVDEVEHAVLAGDTGARGPDPAGDRTPGSAAPEPGDPPQQR
ncbi:DUF6049 family protein [Kineococcus gynurae]|uniref:DUF6049 family protein n=1 Tax=Kineococcus gynurae TaxID=452979 RepID=A0ABV5LT10_9ACTN